MCSFQGIEHRSDRRIERLASQKVGELKECSPLIVANIASLRLCREKLALANEKCIMQMSHSNSVRSLPSFSSKKEGRCSTCVLGMEHKAKNPKTQMNSACIRFA